MMFDTGVLPLGQVSLSDQDTRYLVVGSWSLICLSANTFPTIIGIAKVQHTSRGIESTLISASFEEYCIPYHINCTFDTVQRPDPSFCDTRDRFNLHISIPNLCYSTETTRQPQAGLLTTRHPASCLRYWNPAKVIANTWQRFTSRRCIQTHYCTLSFQRRKVSVTLKPSWGDIMKL